MQIFVQLSTIWILTEQQKISPHFWNPRMRIILLLLCVKHHTDRWTRLIITITRRFAICHVLCDTLYIRPVIRCRVKMIPRIKPGSLRRRYINKKMFYKHILENPACFFFQTRKRQRKPDPRRGKKKGPPRSVREGEGGSVKPPGSQLSVFVKNVLFCHKLW